MKALKFQKLFERWGAWNYKDVSRSKNLTKDQFIELFLENCKNYKGKNKIYRGSHNQSQFNYVNPKQFTRNTANARGNFYNLLIDNLPSWKSYPKRLNGLICSTSEEKTEAYGYGFLVIPYDDNQIALCSGSDIFESFVGIGKKPQEINRYFLEQFDGLDTKGNEFADCTWEEFQKFFNYRITVPKLKNFFKLEKFKNIHEPWKYMNKVLDPIQNNFRLLTTEEYNNLPENELKSSSWSGSGKEIWTDGPCLMINLNKLKMDSELKELLSFSEI